ncbi:hypothetical protein Tco_1163177 [Tanacetum coccineum]
MAAPPSPNHVFNFSADEPHDFDDSDLAFEEDPQEEFEVDPQEDPEEKRTLKKNRRRLQIRRGWHVQRVAQEGTHVKNIKLKRELEAAKISNTLLQMVQAGLLGVRPGEAIDVLAVSASQAPRRLKQRAVERMVQKRVAEAIAEYERNRTNPENAGGSGPANAGGVVHRMCADVCNKTFRNCQPHSFNGTKGVVGLTRWFEKMEQTITVKGDDIEECNNWFHELALMCPNLVTPEKKKIERYIRGLPEKVKANVTSSKPASLHDAINMARELIEQAIQAKATIIGESNKRK